MQVKDLRGQVFGKLCVEGRDGSSNDGQAVWLCRCECGQTCAVSGGHLRTGHTRSCGCLWRETVALSGDESGFRRLRLVYRKGATARGLEFALSDEQFYILTKGNCFYCGVPPLKTKQGNSNRGLRGVSTGNSKPYHYNGIDRKNSSMGYVLENCVSCCWICNRAKMDLEFETFLAWIKKVAIRWNHEMAEAVQDGVSGPVT